MLFEFELYTRIKQREEDEIMVTNTEKSGAKFGDPTDDDDGVF
jgi:hypothetical protein